MATSCYQDEFDEDDDSRLPILFNQRVHKEPIKGKPDLKLNWKISPRGRTTGVACVMCVYIGVAPPGQTKLEDCAKKETWIDPLSMNLQKAKSAIQENIIEQYNAWMIPFNKGRQAKRPIKVELDPTKEKVKKMCENLRKNAKDERVIFHYNGHGVPRPTDNGEIWVFDKNQTQYLSVTLSEIMSYMKSPALYVWDCNRAGLIVEKFNENAREKMAVWRKKKFEELGGLGPNPPPDYTKTSIHLAACSRTQDLPMNPELPADIFTACLTTPVKTALHFWYHSQKINKLKCGPWPEDFLDRIPGKLDTRTTIMGELNWILTAVTDSIGFLTLDIDTFKKLFREDSIIASLFRNFLLADRVMRAYSVTPLSHPAIPSTANHPLWRAWDLTVDSILFELPDIISGRVQHRPSSFFKHQLTAFKVWLQYGKLDQNRPLQLPILLQMLMSIAHRTETLELIGKFLDLGPWAVEQGLGVGLFPYVLRLLSIKRPEHRHILVFIWAKIAACDSAVQEDLLNDHGYKFFISILENPDVTPQTKSMACFVLTTLVRRYPDAQKVCLKNNLMNNCLMSLEDDHGTQPSLLTWATLCLGHFWDRYDQARWQGVRGSAQEKVNKLLEHRHCEVRAAAVFALGTFLYTSADNSDHSVNIDQGVGQMLLKACDDGSTLVRQEVVVALCRFVQQFENNFIVVARTVIEETHRSSLSEDSEDMATSPVRADRIVLQSSLLSPSTRMPGNVFTNAWKYLKRLEHDPFPDVRQLAAVVVKHIENKIVRYNTRKTSETLAGCEGSPEMMKTIHNVTSPLTYSTHFNTRRTIFGRGPSTGDEEEPPNHHNLSNDSEHKTDQILVSTQFTEWCATTFSRPLLKISPEEDPASDIYIEKQWRFKENKKMKKQARCELSKRGFEKLDYQIFAVNNKHRPVTMDFHPYEPLLYVIDEKNYVRLWDYSDSQLKHKFECCTGRVKDALMLNCHYQPSLCVGNGEGQVFIYRNFDREENLATAFRALGEINKRGTPLVMEYSNCNLFVSGNSKKMACWDLIKEKKRADILTQTDSYVTTLNIFDKPTAFLVMAGFNDGMSRVYDLRTPPLERIVLMFGETHVNNKVVKVHVDPARESKFIAAYSNGEMSFWDYRKPTEAPYTMRVVEKNLTSIAFHNYAPVMASGSQEKYIIVHNMWGDKLNLLKFHEGFMGQRMGPVKCLAFHPYKYKLASAGLDNIVSIYGTK